MQLHFEVTAGTMQPLHEIIAEDCLHEFLKTFRCSTDIELWISLLEEEVNEFGEEVTADDVDFANCLKEAGDVLYVLSALSVLMWPEYKDFLHEDVIERGNEAVNKAMHIVHYATYVWGRGTLLEATYRIHESNMSKLGDDGEPLRREDGKVLKGPNYKAPDLSDIAS